MFEMMVVPSNIIAVRDDGTTANVEPWAGDRSLTRAQWEVSYSYWYIMQQWFRRQACVAGNPAKNEEEKMRKNFWVKPSIWSKNVTEACIDLELVIEA